MADTPVNSSNVGSEDGVPYKERNLEQEGYQAPPDTAGLAEQGYQSDLAQKHKTVAGAQSYADTLAKLAQNRAEQEQQIGGSYDAATKAGLGQQQMRGGQALSAVAGDNSAANYGAVLAAGQAQGVNEANYVGQQNLAKTQATTAAHEAALESQAQAAGAQQAANEYAYKAGSDEKERQALRTQSDAKLAQIIKDNKGTFNDDEQTMYNQIVAYAQTIGDPTVRAELIQRANNILAGVEDV